MGPLLSLLLAAAPLPQGDTSVGLLLHDTCAGPHASACSRVGRMFVPGFVTQNQQRAFEASRAYCELLGTPWECLDVRERVLAQHPPDLPAAATYTSRACSRGSPNGCVLWAEALGCGRGVPRDVRQGFAVLRRECEQRPLACVELAIWLDFPQSRAALAGSGARGEAAFYAAEIALTNRRFDRAEELLASLPRAGSPSPERREFLAAMLAFGRGEATAFQEAAARLGKASPADPVARILARIARGGIPDAWVPALVAAWSAEGKPQLRDHPWLLPSVEPQSVCLPDENQPRTGGAPDSVAGFLTQIAHRFHARPRRPPSDPLVAAALKYASEPDPGVRLVAVALLAEPFLSSRQRGTAHRAAVSALNALAEEHPDAPFFALAALVGPDPEAAPVTVEALGRLETLARASALRFPGGALRDTLERNLEPLDFRDFGLSTAAEVELQIGVERYLERVLAAPGERARRLAVVRTLAQQMARSGWLVYLFTGARLLAAVADSSGTEADRGLAASTLARGHRLWNGWTVFPRMGRWPSPALGDELREKGFSDELGVLQRYAELGAQ
jgi:TPR repeat protein